MHDRKPDDTSREKKSYQPPAVAWEETLEVRQSLAAACAKISGAGVGCNQNPGS